MKERRKIIIKSLYFSGEEPDIRLDQLERLAVAEKLSFNAMAQRIFSDWLETNKRYKDAKITDFETVEVLKVKQDTSVYCKECGSYEVDDGGWTIHDVGCSSSRPFREAI